MSAMLHHSSEKLSTGSPRHMAASQALMATWAPSAKHTGDDSTMGQSHSTVTFPPSPSSFLSSMSSAMHHSSEKPSTGSPIRHMMAASQALEASVLPFWLQNADGRKDKGADAGSRCRSRSRSRGGDSQVTVYCQQQAASPLRTVGRIIPYKNSDRTSTVLYGRSTVVVTGEPRSTVRYLRHRPPRPIKHPTCLVALPCLTTPPICRGSGWLLCFQVLFGNTKVLLISSSSAAH